jgi:Putative beta barrel porin-7 (BBP7)
MRHGRLYAAGLTLAIAGLAAGQPDKLPPAANLNPAPATLAPPGPAPATPIPATAPKTTTAPPGTVVSTPTTTAAPVVVADAGADGGQQFWVAAEYLRWKIKDQSLPPLITTGPAQFPVGFLGNAGTVLLFGGNDFDQGTFSGYRLRAGMWLDSSRTLGLEGSIFSLCQKDAGVGFNSNSFPVLTRPFTDVNPGAPNSEFLAFPGIATGGVSVNNRSQFCGATLVARTPICVGCNWRLDGTFGGQYLNLDEQLTITETPLFASNAPFPGLAGTQFVATDRFKTRNQFCGGIAGVDGTYLHGAWMINGTASIAIGNNHQTIEIDGTQQSVNAAGVRNVVAGGLLAVPGGNIGNFSKNTFSVVPQLGLNVGYQLTENVQVFGGYTFLYWTKVVRPGDQIDTTLDVNKIPNFGGGPAATSNRPIVPFQTSDFWAQGVSIGVAFSW